MERNPERCAKLKAEDSTKSANRIRPESEEGEIEDEESDFENHDTSEKDGRYQPIATSREDELNLHMDGEINTGEKQSSKKITENKQIRRSNRENKQPNRYGGITYTKILGYKSKN